MADTTSQQIAAAIAALAGGLGGKALADSGGDPLTRAVPPELSQMLTMANQRYAYQNPLFQATTQGVYDMLPDFAKKGTSLGGGLSNAVPMASGSGDSGPGLGTALGVGGLGSLAALFASNPDALAGVFDAIRKKFGGVSTPGGLKIPGGEFDPTQVYGGAEDTPALPPIAGSQATGSAGGGFKNNDNFWGWEGNPGRPYGGLFPVTPEDPRHD